MCFVDQEKAFDRVPLGVLWGVLRAPLLRAIRSLYDHSRSLVPIAGMLVFAKSCPLPLVLFIIFMDRIFRRSQELKGVQFGDHSFSSLSFADDVSSNQDLQDALECETGGMKIS